MPQPKPRDPDVLERIRKFHPTDTRLWYDQYEKAYRGRERSAPKKGTRFQLSKEEFWTMVCRAGGRCELTGQPFDRFYKCLTGKHPFIPTIDRVVSTGHYTPENCEILTWISNVAISDFGRKEFLKMVKYGTVSIALQEHLEDEERKEGTPPPPGLGDNFLTFIKDGALGRWITRHLLATADNEALIEAK